LSGVDLTLTLGQAHPYIVWTEQEIQQFRERLNDPATINGTRYYWNHPTNSPSIQCQNGNMFACAQIWSVNEDFSAAQKAADHLLNQARNFDSTNFISLGYFTAPNQLKNDVFTYDLIESSGVFTSNENVEILDYFRQAQTALPSVAQFGVANNFGVYLEQAAWAAAFVLQDETALKDSFSRFKTFVGKTLYPHGYYNEGTGYRYAMSDLLASVFDMTSRSDLTLKSVNIKSLAANSYVKPGDFFDWEYYVISPFQGMTNIGDGGVPKFYNYNFLKFAKYSNNPDLLNAYYAWDLTQRPQNDPHVWGDFPPNPTITPTQSIEDAIWPDLGMFIMRSGTGLDPNDQYVSLYSLQRTGYHPHFDQGQINIAKYGTWLTTELESSATTAGYQPLTNDISKPRWGHNTVVVGGVAAKTNIQSSTVNYSYNPNDKDALKVVDFTISNFNNSAPTLVSQRRRAIVTDDYIVMTDNLTSETETTFDWFFHGAKNAQWTLNDELGNEVSSYLNYIPAHSTPDENLVWNNGYQTNGVWSGQFSLGNVGLKVWQLDTANGSYISGCMTPPKHYGGLYVGDSLCLVNQRKIGKEAFFTSILEPYKNQSRIQKTFLRKNSGDERQIVVVFSDTDQSQLISISGTNYAISNFLDQNHDGVEDKPGDANGDNKIDGIDYVIWLNHFGQTVTGTSNGDFNNDSKVDGIDYVIWLNNYGK